MAHRIRLAPHLSTEELFAGYRLAKRASEKTRWQVVWLLSQGKTSQEAAEATGYSQKWVRRLAARYNAEGLDGLQDRRRKNPGQRRLLSPEQQSELSVALEGPAPRGGFWSGPEVARWMSEKLGRTVSPQRGWDYLRQADYTPQVPRPAHESADPELQASFQGRPREARGRRTRKIP
jgi:transposase